MGGDKNNTDTLGAKMAQQRYSQYYGPGGMGGGNDPAVQQANQMQQDFYKRYTDAADRQTADYGDIMSGYKDWGADVNKFQGTIDNTPSTNFSFERVSSPTPAELQEGYGYLRNAGKGYQEFADTGGYSEKDIADLRARGISPVRAAYANAQANIERAKAIGGGYSPNYTAATAKMTRDQSQQAADATQNVNARLAEDIRSGKLAGLGGLTSVGGTMGGLSLQDADRILKANMANQGADIATQTLSEQARQNKIQNQMGVRNMGLSGMNARTGLYGTTPGMASTFGSQALQAMNQRLMAQGMSQDDAARLLSIMSGQQQQESGTAWWKTALAVAGTAAPYVAMAMSDKNLKKDITPVDEKKVLKGIKKLNLATWRYKDDPDETVHMGPMAQDVKKHLGIGDGKTLHLADIMGVMLATSKNRAEAHA